MTIRACPTCGRPIDEHDRHVRYALPDPVLTIPPEERPARTWGADPLIQVQGIGAFVRVPLAIGLSGGFHLTLGTWLAIDPARLRSVWGTWDTDAYAGLALEGYLANAIPPWGDKVLGAPATAVVRGPASFPYVNGSPDPLLSSILTREWPHEQIFDAYRSVL